MKFRKVISLLLSAVMATSMTSFAASAVTVNEAVTTEIAIGSATTNPVNRVLIGDVDLDGVINIKDATQIQKHIVNFITLSGDALTAAECDSDSVVTVKDTTIIQKYLAALGETGKVGKYYEVDDNYNDEDTDGLYSTSNWQNVLDTETRKGNFYFNGKETDSVYGRKVMDSRYYGALFDVSEGERFKITSRTTSNTQLIAFYSDYTYVDGTAAGESYTVLSGYGEHSENYEETFVTVPKGAKYMGVCSYITGSYATDLEVLKWTSVPLDLSMYPNIFNVKDFGAVGDGKHDDTLAFQNCLETANGCPIVVPSGTYIINNTKDGSVSYTGNVTMIGCGMPKLIRTATSDFYSPVLGKLTQKYQPMLTIRDADKVHISGINFDSQRDNLVDPTTNEWFGTAAVYVLGKSSNITIENCVFEQSSREAIFCGEINENLQDKSGAYLNGKIENVQVRNNIFDNVSANFWSHGADIKNVILENNYSNHCRTKGFEFDTENNYRAENIVIRGNEFVDLFQDCILMSNCHDVLIEGNKYSPFVGTVEDYSPHMGTEIKGTESYFLCVVPRPGEFDAKINNSTDFVVRNNKAVCNRFIALKTLNSNKNLSDDDVVFENFEVYDNIADCKECFIRSSYAKNIVSHDNTMSGTYVDSKNSENHWKSPVYWAGDGTNEFIVYGDESDALISKLPSATLNEADKILRVPNFAFTDCASLTLSADSEMTSIDMIGFRGAKFVLTVEKYSLKVTASDTVLIQGQEAFLDSATFAPNSKVEFMFNGSKWIVQG